MRLILIVLCYIYYFLRQISSLTLNQLQLSGFSKVPFLQICDFIQKDPWTLFETILRQTINQQPQNSDHIDGLMLLAIEMAVSFFLKNFITVK